MSTTATVTGHTTVSEVVSTATATTSTAAPAASTAAVSTGSAGSAPTGNIGSRAVVPGRGLLGLVAGVWLEMAMAMAI